MGIIPESQRQKFDLAMADAQSSRESRWTDYFLLVFAFVFAIVIRVVVGVRDSDSSWERPLGDLSPAGWWHTCISLPILYYFLLRWLRIFVIWSHFLFRVSRLDLELTPTHPDRAGGLGFLGW